MCVCVLGGEGEKGSVLAEIQLVNHHLAHLLHGSLHDDPDARWEVGECHLQQTAVCDAILLKPI